MVGLVLVLGSVLLGAQLMADADDSVSVWTLRVDVAAGQEITDAMVVARQVRFADSEQADRYVSGEQALPLPAVATRPLAEGELLPLSALGVSERLLELPLQVSTGSIPSTVRVGSVVDLWSIRSEGVASRSVLQAVPVLAMEESGVSSRVVVGLSREQADGLPTLLAELDGSVVVVRRPVP